MINREGKEKNRRGGMREGRKRRREGRGRKRGKRRKERKTKWVKGRNSIYLGGMDKLDTPVTCLF